MPPDRHIVAFGGVDWDEPLRNYVLELTGERRPKVCLVATAIGDSAAAIAEFYERFPAARCEPSHLRLFGMPTSVRDRLLENDAIVVSGGNTANMLAVWRVHGVHAALREAWEQGTVLTGASAGAICWFEAGVTDSFGPQLDPIDNCLGFLAGSMCPHYDGEERRRPVYRRLVDEGALPAGLAADDDVGLHFVGTELVEVVANRAGPPPIGSRTARRRGSTRACFRLRR